MTAWTSGRMTWVRAPARSPPERRVTGRHPCFRIVTAEEVLMKQATLKEVAKLAGVSIKTASRVANSEDNVRADTRLRVRHAIEMLNYRPNEHARNLAAARRT